MTKQKSILVIMIVSLVFNLAFLSGFVYRLLERSKYPKHPVARHFMKDRSAGERMEMPEELRERMRDVHERFSPRMREFRERVRAERNVLVEILMADQPDSMAVENQLKRIGEFQLDIEREVVHRLFREKDLLPLEQRRQFLEMVTRRLGGSSRPPGMGPGRMRNHRKNEERIRNR